MPKKLTKIFVFAPATHTEVIIEAMARAGAGNIGTYSHCAFITHGTGNYLPKEGSQPFIGKVGEMSQEPEDKIEMICEFEAVAKVIAAIKKVHPYESPTIDVIEILFETKEEK